MTQRRRMRFTIEVDYDVEEGREPDEVCSIGAASRILNAFRSGGMHIPGAQIADLAVGGGFVPTEDEGEKG